MVSRVVFWSTVNIVAFVRSRRRSAAARAALPRAIVDRNTVAALNEMRASYADRYLYSHLERKDLIKLAVKYRGSRPSLNAQLPPTPIKLTKIEIPRRLLKNYPHWTRRVYGYVFLPRHWLATAETFRQRGSKRASTQFGYSSSRFGCCCCCCCCCAGCRCGSRVS